MPSQPTSSTLPSITLHQKGDISRMLVPGGERMHSMNGFDEQFTDIVQYIVKITHEIWEQNSIGAIYDYYSHNCPVHTAEGTIYGREAAIAGTVATLAGFPDRRLYADEVIWAGDDETSFYTSHRITHVGRNSGYSSFGPPTGRQVRYNAIADCVVRENRIVEEWLVRDNVTQIRQLGFDPLVLAKEMAEREAAAGINFQIPGEIERVAGQNTPLELPPPPDEFDVEDLIRRSTHQIWNWRLLNVVDETYAPTYTGNLPSGRESLRTGRLQGLCASTAGRFPRRYDANRSFRCAGGWPGRLPHRHPLDAAGYASWSWRVW